MKTITLTNEQIARRVTKFETIKLVSESALNSIISGRRMSDKSIELMNDGDLLAAKAKESGEIKKIIVDCVKSELLNEYKTQYPELTRYDIAVDKRVHIATNSNHLFFDIEISNNKDGCVIQLTEQ